jgi:hypothetical protein
MGLQAINIAECFVRLVKAKDMSDIEYKQELLDYDGGNSKILDNYVLDCTGDGEYTSVINLETLRSVATDIDTVQTVFLYGSEFDRRCWGSAIQVYLTETGEVYMDEAFMDSAFG